jgi:uncharacterized Zn-binding protein involved in type VI secretion
MPQMIRDGDPTTTGHGCDAVTTVTGPTGASSKVFANGIAVETVTNPTAPHTIPSGDGCVPHDAVINVGSSNVFTGGLGIARQGDSTDGGAIISGSSNVFVNTKGQTKAAMGWTEVAVSPAAMESMFNADNEERVEFNNLDVDANENGEYGDGYFGESNPRGDSAFDGNSSPTTGETGVLTDGEPSESNFPEAGSESVVFLPHTDPRIDPSLATMLETIATNLNTTLTITSAYRSPDYNARVGGKKASKHMQGIAVDVAQNDWNNQTRIDFIQECIDQGIQGIGIYNSFTHIDLGGKRAWGPTGSRRSLPQQSWAIPVLQSNGYATG